MAVSSLRQIITGQFVKGLASQSKVSNSSATFNANSADAASLDVSLRTGARNLSLGLQALNVGITFINVSKNTHERLLDVVTQMELLVAKGAKGGVGVQSSGLMQQEFQSLNSRFQKIIREAKLEGNDVLDVDSLSAVMIRGGLDPAISDDIGSEFRKVAPVSKTAADGSSTTPATSIPLDSFATALRRATAEFSQAEENGEEFSDGSSFFKTVREKLEELHTQLEGNIKALDSVRDVVQQNMDLVRAAGFAMLDLSSEVKGNEDPETIARRIQDAVRRGAPGALDQAEHINSIMVAGLSLNPNTFKSVAKKNTSSSNES